jgi:hypothetical protein
MGKLLDWCYRIIGGTAPRSSWVRPIPSDDKTTPLCPACFLLIQPGSPQVCVPPGDLNCVRYHEKCWGLRLRGEL